MQSHYEINVAKNGVHLFATAERSVITEVENRLLVNLLRQKFPESEGYTVSSTYFEIKGYGVTV